MARSYKLRKLVLKPKVCGTDQSSRLTPSPSLISLHIHVRIKLITSKIRSLTTCQYLLLIGKTLSANQSKRFISVISIDHIVSQVFPDPHYKGAFQCDLLLNILRIHLVWVLNLLRSPWTCPKLYRHERLSLGESHSSLSETRMKVGGWAWIIRCLFSQ